MSFTLDSVAQNSLISEFRASYVRSACLFKNTDLITFFSHNDSSLAPTPYLRLSLKTSSQRAFSHFTFLQKKLKFYKPRKTCGFYNHSIGESQPMWITDSRVKAVESVWSLVGIETKGSIRCPNAVVIKLIRKDWKWFVKQNASFIFIQKKRYATERSPALQGNLSIVYSTRLRGQSYSNHASRSPFYLWFLEEQSCSK